MLKLQISDVVQTFWDAVGGSEPYPRNLEEPVLWALPLAIVKLPRLWIRNAENWARKQDIPLRFLCDDRPLRACLIAKAGKGFVILDGTDPEDERRLSLAHEIAHFMLDYSLPRRKAIAHFGVEIIDVLDGHRAPSMEERFSSILVDVPVGIYTHLMDRDQEGGYIQGNTAIAESRAERLALELLAPESDVREAVERQAHPASQTEALDHITATLTEDFGLPHNTSVLYAKELAAHWYGPQSVRSWLGLAEKKNSCRTSGRGSE